MRKVILILNFLLIVILCCSCDKKVEESESGHNRITQQELQNKHNNMVSELVVDFSEMYNKTQSDNYVFSGLSFYNSVQIMKYISKSEKSKDYSQIVGNDYSIYRDGSFLKKILANFDRNKIVEVNSKYYRENTGNISLKNEMYINNYSLSNYNISVIIEQYYADIFAGSKEENAQLFTGISISNVWNDCDGLLRLTESDYTFNNCDGTESQCKFLIGGNIGSKHDFGDFIGFKINTSDIDIFFLLPKEQVDVNDIFTIENIINLQKHNYVNSLTNYTRCLFPEFEIKTSIDVNDFIKSEYNILEEDLQIIQSNSLKINRYGINSTEITPSSDDIEYTGTRYEYLDDFIIDRPFGVLVSYNDILLYSAVVKKI